MLFGPKTTRLLLSGCSLQRHGADSLNSTTVTTARKSQEAGKSIFYINFPTILHGRTRTEESFRGPSFITDPDAGVDNERHQIINPSHFLTPVENAFSK